MVELRDGGRVAARLSLETYLASAPEDLVDGEPVLVFECTGCHCFHDLGTMDEVVAAFGAARAVRQYSAACVMGAARGAQ